MAGLGAVVGLVIHLLAHALEQRRHLQPGGHETGRARQQR